MGTPPGPTGWRNDPDFASYSRHPESGRRSLHVLGEGTSGAGRSFGSTFDFEGSATLAWSARPDRAGAIGAASVNQAVKAVAIARQFVEEEAIDLCCRPEFVELSDDQLGDGTAGGPTSALRLLVLVEQT